MLEVSKRTAPHAVGFFSTELVDLALRGLASMYDERQKLFSYRIWQGCRTAMPLIWSIPYTAIALLGLTRAQQCGWHDIPVDQAGTLHSLVRLIDNVQRPGDLGLILWADAAPGSRRHTMRERIGYGLAM